MNITNRQQLLGIVAIVAVALLAGDRLLFTPLVQSWKDRSVRLAQLRKSVAQGTQLLERERAIREHWEHMRTNTLSGEQSIAEGQVLRALDRWQQDSRISVTSVGTHLKQTADDYATLECHVDGSGNLSALTRFVYEIEKDPLMALDLHAAQIQGFFDVPVDHLFSAPVMIEYFKTLNIPDLMVVSPDAGGVERARAFGKRMNAPLAIIDKRRDEPNVAEVMNVVGEVEGRNCLLVDDLIDTAGTLVNSSAALLKSGAVSVIAVATHAVLSPPAVERIGNSEIKEVVLTNSIPLAEEARACAKIRTL